MSEINDGGQAFPMASDLIGHSPGMTLRDWFAGQALTGLLANGEAVAWRTLASQAYSAADAMLEAQAKGGAA